MGLTVVAWGTSAPELIVSLVAALRGSADMMLGNVIGSNLANIGLILGLAALILPPAVDRRLLRFEMPLLLGATLLFCVFCWFGGLGRLDGAVMLALFVAFTWITVRRPREAVPSVPGSGRGRLISSLMMLGGTAGLVGGAHLIVESATDIALRLGVSELVIGVSLVAVGTSLPELATTVVAAAKGEGGIAVGNVIGSNLFNLLAVAGPAALLAPVADTSGLFARHLPGLLGVTVLMGVLMMGKARVGRFAGAMLLIVYVVVLAWWTDLLP